MNHSIYILYSDTADKYYVGETEDVLQRLILHNLGTFSGSSTKIASDWKILATFLLKNRIEARIVEKYIKQMKSRKFTESLIANLDFFLNFKELVFQKFNIIISKQ
jgi:putative endonuclease